MSYNRKKTLPPVPFSESELQQGSNENPLVITSNSEYRSGFHDGMRKAFLLMAENANTDLPGIQSFLLRVGQAMLHPSDYIPKHRL